MMSTKNATLLILAGGLGSRYKGKKQIDPMGPSGECLMEYSIYDAKNAGFTQIVVIINDYFNEETKVHFQNIADSVGLQLDFAVQNSETYLPEHHRDKLKDRVKPWGTAHAILCAKEYIKNPFVVINADDYYNRHAFNKAFELISSGKINDKKFGMVAYHLPSTLSDNGTVSRGVCTIKNGHLMTVEEHQKIQRKAGKIVFEDENGNEKELPENTWVSMNFWILDSSIFNVLQDKFEVFLSQIKTLKDEFFIPFVIDEMIKSNSINVVVENSKDQWFGVTYPEDKQTVIDNLNNMVNEGKYPKSLWN